MSELHSERELQLARVRRPIDSGTSIDGASLLDIAARISVVDVIEDIEGIHPELEKELFTDGEILLNSEIGVEEVRTKDTVAAHSSYLVQPRPGEIGSQLGLIVGQIVPRVTRKI
jgi:hypothetical protein